MHYIASGFFSAYAQAYLTKFSANTNMYAAVYIA
ncbi:MAG: hypothetical protein ACJAX2_002938, partial [Celeribacter sp.]